jgi:hypothetical protein
MTRAGDPGAPLEPGTLERLRVHATSIAAAASVPGRMRADVIEELAGHLIERTAALIASGLPEADAAAKAIAGFGGVADLATDLSGAFHSRLWSSTIGVLVPAIAIAGHRPGVIGWMRLTLGIGVAITLLALVPIMWQETPGHLLFAMAAVGLGVFGLVLAFQALGRGQRWALWYAIGFAVELVVFGVISVVAATPGTTTVPLGAILGAGVLLGARSAWERLQSFTAGSTPVARPLQALLATSFLAPLLVIPVIAAIPDPTQAASDDLRLLVSVTCDRGEIIEPGYPSRPDVQRVRIVADMEWRRGDLWPTGLDGVFNPTNYGDTAGFRLDSEAMGDVIPHWLLVGEPAVVDVESGAVAGWFGSTAPSVELIPDTIGSFTVGIDLGAIGGGRTLRAEWLVAPSSDDETPWPTVEVAYAHLDRFLITASAGCGETAVGREASFARDRSLPVPLDPFDGMLP